MKKIKFKGKRGITLISLVITIIILIILVGFTISLTIGDNGLFNIAKKAKNDYEQATIEEQEEINELYECLAQEELPENTRENPQDAGTKVRMPSNWYTTTPAYVSTEEGSIVKRTVKVASVTAVATGNGETVPVPNGFYYVGGNLDTGVIISDNVTDKYDGQTDKTTYKYTTSLQGNQFVWIPCSSSEYKKTNWERQNAEWDTTTSKSELTQIEKYGGFYVARYEAGLASTITEFTTDQNHTGSNQEYNLYGVPQSKAGIVPWLFIDWTHSKANAESMYNNSYVSSGLITGTQWDVILNTLINKTDLISTDITASSAWGNYMDNSISYTGRLASTDYDLSNSNPWTLKPFGTVTTGETAVYSSNNGDILTTGASATTEKYHIFDLAGNLWEWTEEDSHYATSGQYRVLRGGSCHNISRLCPACYRFSADPISWTGFDFGFRTVLYIN